MIGFGSPVEYLDFLTVQEYLVMWSYGSMALCFYGPMVLSQLYLTTSLWRNANIGPYPYSLTIYATQKRRLQISLKKSTKK